MVFFIFLALSRVKADLSCADYPECNGDFLGLGNDEKQSLKFLGRTISITAKGIEWEGVNRHAEAYLTKIEEHAAATGPSPSGGRIQRGVSTPGVERDNETLEDRVLLDQEGTTAYRGLVALLNFIAQDRPVMGFSSKEASKTMASPAVRPRAL